MNRLNKKRLAFFGVIAFFLATSVFTADALFSLKTKSNWVNINGTWVSAKARVDAIHIPESINGECKIQSYTEPARNINVIGFTYWQCDVINPNGQVTFHLDYPGEVNYNSSSKSKSTGTIYNVFINSGWRLKSWGTHDFNHNGANPSPWRPSNLIITS